MKYNETNLDICSVGSIRLIRTPLVRTLDSWVDIQTTAERAWEALADLASWKDWNSFIPKAEGTLAEGSSVSIVVKSPGLKEMAFAPTVFEVAEGRKLSWGGGSVWIGYKGIHEFLIEPLDGQRIRFRQIEKFQGPVVWFMNRMILKTAAGYANMNKEFKNLLENGSVGPKASGAQK